MKVQYVIAIFVSSLVAEATPAQTNLQSSTFFADSFRDLGEDIEFGEANGFIRGLGCIRANKVQIEVVNAGAQSLTKFLSQCSASTNGSPWCNELIRPNPQSHPMFDCTYSVEQAHLMIHPDEMTWKYAFKAVQLIEELQNLGIRACTIYNWWRPEPYNANVGGAKGRHPFGTSIDVRFCTMNDMERAFSQLCQWRRQGRLRAIGYYGSTALHFGIGDRTANTWGKSCP